MRLAKFVAASCALFGVDVNNILNTVIEVLPFMARDREQARTVEEAVNAALEEVADLQKKIAERLSEEGRKLLNFYNPADFFYLPVFLYIHELSKFFLNQ